MVTGLLKTLDHNELFEFESDNSLRVELLPKLDLHDESVDMLTFLRGYFKTENN
jgi:hypothetical protein